MVFNILLYLIAVKAKTTYMDSTINIYLMFINYLISVVYYTIDLLS